MLEKTVRHKNKINTGTCILKAFWNKEIQVTQHSLKGDPFHYRLVCLTNTSQA